MAIDHDELRLEPWPSWRRLWEEGPWAWLGRWNLPASVWFPAVDVVERPEELVVQVELPGVDPEQVDVEVHDHQLRVRGQVRRAVEAEEGGIVRSERRYGSFSRIITLPAEVDAERADARYRHGVLEIRLPKKEQARRRIPVRRES